MAILLFQSPSVFCFCLCFSASGGCILKKKKNPTVKTAIWGPLIVEWTMGLSLPLSGDRFRKLDMVMHSCDPSFGEAKVEDGAQELTVAQAGHGLEATSCL